jgi:hypothetical protein
MPCSFSFEVHVLHSPELQFFQHWSFLELSDKENNNWRSRTEGRHIMWLTAVNQAHQINSNLFHFAFIAATYILRRRLQAEIMIFRSDARNVNSVSLFKLQKWNLQIRDDRCACAAYIKANPLRVLKLSQMLSEPSRYWHTVRTDKRKALWNQCPNLRPS